MPCDATGDEKSEPAQAPAQATAHLPSPPAHELPFIRCCFRFFTLSGKGNAL
jgi:hypothetical protein